MDGEGDAKQQEATKAPVRKRGPGRPPKRQKAPPLDLNGIADAPKFADNRMEFMYDDPMVFKRLFQYLKGLKVQSVHLKCTPAGLVFFARDSASACRVVAEFPGASVHHFYSEDTFFLGLNHDFVKDVFACIDKSFFKVSLSVATTDPDALNIVFHDVDLDKKCHYRVQTSRFDSDAGLFAAEQEAAPDAEAAYPLRFTLTARQLKKTISDASQTVNLINIEKLEGHNLQVTHERANVVYREVYGDAKKIKLEADGANGFFRISVSLANIKPLATVPVSDEVQVCCSEDRDILFRSVAGAMRLSTLVRRA